MGCCFHCSSFACN